MVDSDMPAYPNTPKTPFDFPDEITERIFVEYYKHEVLVYSKPLTVTTSSTSHYDPRHSKGPLGKYKKFFTRHGASILNMTSINQRIRQMALPHLVKAVYFDLKDRDTLKRFLEHTAPFIVRHVHHITTRASLMNYWGNPLFQRRRFPSLKTLTIYEDWSKGGWAEDKSSVQLEDARVWNEGKKAWEYTKEAQAVVERVKEREKTVIDSRASAPDVAASIQDAVDHAWISVKSLLAAPGRSYVVELAWYINMGMDAVLEVEKEEKPVKLVVGMACERNNMMKMRYFMEEKDL